MTDKMNRNVILEVIRGTNCHKDDIEVCKTLNDMALNIRNETMKLESTKYILKDASITQCDEYYNLTLLDIIGIRYDDILIAGDDVGYTDIRTKEDSQTKISRIGFEITNVIDSDICREYKIGESTISDTLNGITIKKHVLDFLKDVKNNISKKVQKSKNGNYRNITEVTLVLTYAAGLGELLTSTSLNNTYFTITGLLEHEVYEMRNSLLSVNINNVIILGDNNVCVLDLKNGYSDNGYIKYRGARK